MGKEEAHGKLGLKYHTIAGAVSGVFARCVGQPFDVLKIRFQLQNIENGRLKYTGVVSAARLIVKEEGFFSLWKGHVPAQVLSVLYGAVQFTTFEYVKSSLLNNRHAKETKRLPLERPPLPFVDFASGAVAGTCATIFSHPVDVIRTRLVAQSNIKVYNSLSHAVTSMAKEEGIRTFYKGIIPNVSVILPYAGLNFCFYGIFKSLWTFIVSKENSKMQSLACGSFSGMFSKLALLPMDNMKKRLQVQGFKGHAYIDGGMIAIAKILFHQQSFRGFYQGASVSVIKAAITTGITFFSYEQTCNLMRKYVA